MADKIFGVLYGPSCVGKSLVTKALREFCHLDFYEPPVIKAKECRPKCKPRPEDIPVWDNPDYFRFKEEIRELEHEKDPRYIVAICRAHSQVFDLENVIKSEKPVVFRDLYYSFIPSLKETKYLEGKAKIKTIFLSPFEEKDLHRRFDGEGRMGSPYESFFEDVACMMAQRLAIRSFKQKGDGAYSEDVIIDNIERATMAHRELVESANADVFIYNPFPEGHPAWNYDDKSGLFLREPEKEAMDVVKQVENALC